MPRLENTQQTKFYSLFVPPVDWFQDLLKTQTQKGKGSLSDHLISLVFEDLRSRKLLTKKEIEAYTNYVEKKPEIPKSSFGKSVVDGEKREKDVHTTFSLYLPKPEKQSWIREKLDVEYVKTHISARSRSLYVWNLLVQEHRKSLTKDQIAEWNETMNGKRAPKTPRVA